jgi:amino-acid N-acetyltransferase
LPVRKAKITDVKAIHRLVNEFAKKGEMIPRSLNDLYENIRDIYVYEGRGEIKEKSQKKEKRN